MLQAGPGLPRASVRGRTRVRTVAVLSPPPPGQRPPPQGRAPGGQSNGGSASPAPPLPTPPPAPASSSSNGNGSNSSKAARQLLEELRALTFQRTLEREQQQQDAARRARQQQQQQGRRPARGGGGAADGSGGRSASSPAARAAPSAPASAPASSSTDDEEQEAGLLVLPGEGDTLLPRLPSSAAAAAAARPSRASPSPASPSPAAAASAPGPAAAPPSAPPSSPPTPADAVLYFAFGANLSAATLRRRGVYEVYAHEPAFVEDPQTRLAFRHRGGYATLHGGALTAGGGGWWGRQGVGRGEEEGAGNGRAASGGGRSVSPSRVGVLGALQGASEARADEDAGGRAASAAAAIAASAAGAGAHPPHVHGVLYSLSRADLGRLAGAEGGYSLREVDVVTYGGRRARALTFVSGAMAALPADVRPTERYLSALREGAADHHLDPVWQAWLSGLETVPSAGLGPEYFDSPSRHLGTAFLAAVGLATAVWLAHTYAPVPPVPVPPVPPIM